MKQSPVLMVILFSFISCNKSTQLDSNERKEIIDEVHQTIKNCYDDMRKDGMTAEFKYLDSSAEFFWVPPGYASSISYDSVAAVIKKNALLLKSVSNSFDTLLVIPITKEFAQFSERTHSTITDTTGKVSEATFLETGLMVKRKDGWKFFCGQTSMVSN